MSTLVLLTQGQRSSSHTETASNLAGFSGCGEAIGRTCRGGSMHDYTSQHSGWQKASFRFCGFQTLAVRNNIYTSRFWIIFRRSQNWGQVTPKPQICSKKHLLLRARRRLEAPPEAAPGVPVFFSNIWRTDPFCQHSWKSTVVTVPWNDKFYKNSKTPWKNLLNCKMKYIQWKNN